ncbi:LysR family transcriptional regulator [Phytohabitans sp. ZYX-F-186]|uniref:LysR family transcriptional regulator n=1 Tax=Phytohabitans maris TaxID=3071409 RepID=A0ABU0ZLW0_9ACTN|nr:LysR family transcriptional regulator [Phytohabitans sp. ZYX-F-186]MDQ7908023.1 LysR family transcriptional regulator [Phytohabitans sp. ZYX-F-186]
MIDMRQLVMFRQVVESGSFSAAAREMRCTQPAVSQQMRALERGVGGPLFARVGRGLQLTEAGQALARYAAEILDGVAVAQQRVRAIATEMGTVRLCAFPSANATLVPKAAAALKERHPHLRLELLEDEPPQSYQALRQARCDVVVAFTYEPGKIVPADVGMLEVPLLADPLVLLVPAGHPLGERASVALAELAGATWIAGCPRCRQQFLKVCQDAGFSPSIACATDDNMALQGLVAAGLGIALVPALVLAFMRHPEVTAVPVEPVGRRRVSAYTWPDLARGSAVAATLTALQDAARRLEVPSGTLALT